MRLQIEVNFEGDLLFQWFYEENRALVMKISLHF